LTAEALVELLRPGVAYQEAWEAVGEEWAFLPAETDEEEEEEAAP
jgi:hypothetical protein